MLMIYGNVHLYEKLYVIKINNIFYSESKIVLN